jgi:leucyl aminopeptidase
MTTNLIRVAKADADAAKIYLADGQNWAWANGILDAAELAFVQKTAEKGAKNIQVNKAGQLIYVSILPADRSNASNASETMRRQAAKTIGGLRQYFAENVVIINTAADNFVYQAAEGLVLVNYQFRPHLATSKRHPITSLKTVQVLESDLAADKFAQLHAVCDAVLHARDLVNEPLHVINAVTLAEDFDKTLSPLGVKVEILDKTAIQSLKMGGLLGVNQGSEVPPTFTIMEWKPEGAKNTQPIVLVGKGIVFDTGGYSLKPTPDSMDHMKCDMAGAALVAGVMQAAATTKLPLHLIALVPATDNHCDAKAYVPGDILTISSGATVEVLNTDAEGRLILADALHFAKRYNPAFVFDFATLTGAAARSIGQIGCALMGNADANLKNAVIASGYNTYERAVELPLWDEYGDMIKSDIADIKNTGGALAGAQTAGKFLEYFTDYPWLHFDIAGVAFFMQEDGYMVRGGTGWGIRSIYDFLATHAKG